MQLLRAVLTNPFLFSICFLNGLKVNMWMIESPGKVLVFSLCLETSHASESLLRKCIDSGNMYVVCSTSRRVLYQPF